ncbi:octopamine receptor beta-2R [Hydra vulgaris]|uniref:octopamine receptor beta-2R n=1 Tax=Hydra vulgaris TaxID=6087 RepID=UPI0006415FF4|nr:octopamine receptor beta-2R [Hydra vulgaris]XP_047128043.1 octopamine receptor beta-2R [Hydra vulgaris]
MLNTSAAVTSLLILAIAATSLNSLCIHIIRRIKSLKKRPSSILTLNVLLVHLLQGLIVLPLYAAKKFTIKSFHWAQFIDNSFRVTYMITFYGTVLGVFCISIDRFLATYWLKSYKQRITKKRVCVSLFLLWIYIITLCMIPFIPSFPLNTSLNVSSFDKIYIYVQQDEWVIFMLIFNTALPYILTIVIYTYIICRLQALKKKHDRLRDSTNSVQQKGPLKMRDKDLERYRKITYLTVVLTVFYGIFWTPSFIYYPLLSFCKSCFSREFENSSLEQYLGFVTKYLAFLNGVAAPLIYCFYHENYRQGFTTIRRSILYKFSKPLDICLTTLDIPVGTMNENSSTPEKMYYC